MATNEQLALEDLGKVHRLVETQGQLMTSEAVDQLAAVWERKINGLNLSADMAQKFVEQLKQGPWSDHHKKGLITAINSSVLKNTTSSPNRRKLQDIPNISTFLSKKDFEVLANGNVPLQNKIDQVVCRMVRLGMHCPSEPSVGRIVVVMTKLGVNAGKNDGNETWALVKEVKRVLKCRINGLPKDPEHIVQYPATPAQLPEWLQKRAYDEHDAPGEGALSLLDLSDSKVALRSNSKLLPKNQQTSLVPRQPSSSSTGVDMSNPMAGMMQMQMMCWQNMMNMMNPETQTNNFNLNLLRPLNKTQQKALPAPPTTIPLQDNSQTEDSQEQPLQKIDKTPMEAEEPSTAKKAEEPTKEPLALPAPPQKALTLPDLSAEAVMAAVGNRTEAKDAKKAAAEAASLTDPGKDNKAKAKAKASAKAKAKSKAKSQLEVDNAAIPEAKAKAKALAKVKGTDGAEQKPDARPKHKPAPKQDRVIYNKDNKPPTPEEGSGTVWYCSGKIHRNAKEWRVFMDCADRCDKKVKIGENPDESFRRCLTLIDANDVD